VDGVLIQLWIGDWGIWCTDSIADWRMGNVDFTIDD